MMAAPVTEKPVTEPPRNVHAGAASAGTIAIAPTRGQKDSLDEAADLFKVIFKGEIIP